MLSPAKCESEEARDQLDLHSSPRSEPECLALVLWVPSSEEGAAQSSSREEATKLGEMSLRRSNCDSPKENGGGEGGVSQRKSSRGKPQRLLMLTNGQVRRSPRFTATSGNFNNVCSIPVIGNSNRAREKKESSDSQGLTFKDIAGIGKSLELEIISESQYKNNVAEGRSRLRDPAKRKVGSDASSSCIKSSYQSLGCNKRMRRSPRFMKGKEKVGEEILGKSREKGKSLASGSSFKRCSRLSGVVENGHAEMVNTIKSCGPALCAAEQVRGTEKLVQISEIDNCCEAIKKCEGDGVVSSKQEVLVSLSGCSKTNVNGCRDRTLGEPRSSDLNADDIHTRSLKISENGTSNGLTMTTGLVEQEAVASLLQGKTSACGAADKGITREMHVNSTMIYLSDSNEQSSVEYLYMRSSNGDILTQVKSRSTLSSGGNEEIISLDQNNPTKSTKRKSKRVIGTAVQEQDKRSICFFIGEPISCEEAQERWRWRYDLKERKSKNTGQQSKNDENKIVANVECHYSQAKVDGHTFSLGDFACIKGEEEENHIGKIVEFFKTTDGESYFRVQWFYRATDTVMKQQATNHDKRRLFYSTVMNDNPVDCLVSRVTVLQVSPRAGLKPNSIKSDYYFDMEYCVEYSTFRTLRNPKSSENKHECRADVVPTKSTESILNKNSFSGKLPVLDLYSGCGGMSTGLSLGAKISGVGVVTKWAVDQNMAACESLKLNHPNTKVRNDAAGDFLLLLKEWDRLCKRYVLNNNDQRTDTLRSVNSTKKTSESSSSTDDDSDSDEYEVEKLVDICYGDPNKTGKIGLRFKVHWKGYSSNEDTWELAEELSNCQDAIREFVTSGFKSKILPLPGGVGVICGGPPCQGISGYNRYRNVDSPLNDERNQQIIVFMDIVEYLKPSYVLMENVVDILRLDQGSLGRYALSRLVNMRYQARLGIMAAGCYGLSQFRSRVFMWGAVPDKNLPPFPLPTHDVIVRYGFPLEFERNVVAYDEGQPRILEKALVLKDAISDLPHVSNDEDREKMPYESLPQTDFQRYIRSTKNDLTGSPTDNCNKRTMLLHDHRPFHVNEDDYARVCQIPKRKGANFRDLPGLIVRNNTVCRDPSMEPVILPSGKSLVPEYVFTFQQGKSKRPFARLWWDETVPTVLTVPSCHNQALLHPEQDRMLTIRESARLQGFPDYFQFCGTMKQRYCQIGNAVAVSVSRALGYSLGMAFRDLAGDEHLIKLPQNFSHSTYPQLQETIPR
ncbi:PREDICTED: DNA (cytosine-5)-methyltransferase CMT2-like [Camelina sativa]|uniref:DNA (cytosine-5-)-methyltransferase n=1 Tax=Camelina sativa TaxID=90675 RepID=A0ABM0V1I2_CAMSA|nr:PREDICTED: DNA (cytosine-5)-methyltransferase CMT2-like [Camelina sativa]